MLAENSDPVEILRAAAAKLREMAEDLGDWWYDEKHCYVRYRNGNPLVEITPCEGRWIALMGPDKAEILAQWLEREALRLAGHINVLRDIAFTPERITASSECLYGIALAFARSILEDK